jgi:RNA polymerase sigma factor (TIGR02999 family)
MTHFSCGVPMWTLADLFTAKAGIAAKNWHPQRIYFFREKKTDTLWTSRFTYTRRRPIMQPTEVTQMLLAWSHGDEEALHKLVPVVYEELRRLARHYMSGERTGHTLQTTALVHEAYARLVDTPNVRWRDRAHFFAVCAQLMRRVLVDCSRSRGYLKRGGDLHRVPINDDVAISGGRGQDLLAIDQALTALASIDPRKSQVVELRFFGGMSVQETAEALKISPETVQRDWKLAKVWLLRELGGGAECGRERGTKRETGREA